MSGGIFLLHTDGHLDRMDEQPYDSETMLQELLGQYPDLLAGDQIDLNAPRRWLLVRREAPIPTGPAAADSFALDHLFLDQDGIPTLVEVKRSSDTRLRREVIGQMLDYAANAVVYWPVDRLRSAFETRCEVGGADPQEEFINALGELDYEAF